MERNSTSFYRGTLWLVISAIILKLIGLIYKIPMHRILGDEGMGYFNSAYTYYTFFYVISTAGIPKAISILVAKNEAENRFSSYSLFQRAFRFFFIFGILILVVFVIVSPLISKYVSGKGSLLSMYAVAPSILFVCAGGVIRGYLTGKMSFVPIAISELLSGCCKLCFGLTFASLALKLNRPLSEICAYSILGITIGSLFSLVQLWVAAIKTRKGEAQADLPPKGIIKDIARLAVPLTLASAGSGIINLLDLTLIMNGLSAMDVSEAVASTLYGNYSTLAIPMFTLVTTLITPISSAIMPEIAKSSSAEELNEQITRALTLTSLVTVPAATFFALFPTEVLFLLFEKESAILGSAFLAALAPAILLIGPLTVINTTHEAKGRVNVPVVSLLVGGAIKLLTSTLLIRTSVGLFAVPFGTCMSYLISLVISFFALRAEMRTPRVMSCTVVPLIASIVGAIPVILLKNYTEFSSKKPIIILGGVIFVVIYFAFCLIFSKNTRKTLANFVKMTKNTQKRL